MKTMTVRLRAPADLSLATLARTLNDLGIWVEAVPQHGTGAHVRLPREPAQWPPVRGYRLHAIPVCPEGSA